MYLQANPGRARTEAEKEETKKSYVQGEDVLLIARRAKEANNDEEDRRIVDEVRELSLREVGMGNIGYHHRIASRRAEDARHRRRHERDHSGGAEVAGPSASTDPVSQARRIEHQSSLRSLLSNSDVDSSDIQEEILRQIREDGILDGIDLDHLDVSQEDELSERIAEAYRRRHGLQARQQEDHNARPQSSESRDQRADAPEQREHRRPGRSPNPPDSSSHSSHPPISRPHLFEAYPTGQGHRRRTSSEHRRQTSPTPAASSSRVHSDTQRQAARSATDLSHTSRTSSNQRQRPTDLPGHSRRTSDSDHLRPPGEVRDSALRASQDSRRPRTRPRAISSSQANAATVPSPQPSPNTRQRPDRTLPQQARQSGSPRPAPRALSQPSATNATQPPSFLEPSISCDRCGKKNLEYELHENCRKCNEGKYNLCLRCYWTDRGCLHWFGFGYIAMQRYWRREPPGGYPPNHSLPHRLVGHRYLPPPSETRHVAVSGSSVRTSSDPSTRLQSGPFCSNCSNYTPDCYWKCEVCNWGEWGYCNVCVNQGKCCTHALLPSSHPDYLNPRKAPTSTQSQHSSITPLIQSASSTSGDVLRDPLTDERYIPLTVSTKCDICTYPIPPSSTRFHCPQCYEGEYDICSSCYYKLLNAGKIRTENGPKGWRRCLSGHRMVVMGYEDSTFGQKRIVVEDLVGGHALKDDSYSDSSIQRQRQEDEQRQSRSVSKDHVSRANDMQDPPLVDGAVAPPLLKTYPPNGGVGMRVQALWSWWPAEGANDELAFPKGAEIRECKNVNGEWYWGSYCGRLGLFPSEYGKVLETIRM